MSPAQPRSLSPAIARAFIIAATAFACVASASAQSVVGPNDISYRERLTVAARFNSGGPVVADSVFNFDRPWFSAGPSWLMNAMPGIQLRARPEYIYDRDGDLTESSEAINRYVNDAGMLPSRFDVMLFNNVARFGYGGGTLSKAVTPYSPDATNAIETLQWNSSSAGASFVGSNWYDVTTSTSGVGPGGVSAFNILNFVAQGTPNSAAPTTVLSAGATSTSFSALSFANNFNSTNSTTIDKSTSGNVAWHVAAGGTISDNASSGTVTFSNTGTGGFKFQLQGATTITVATGARMVFNAPIIIENDTSSTGSITKSGGGTLIFSGANTYSAGTTINAGTFLATNTTGSATGLGAVAVNNNGTVLGGTGFIGGQTTVGGGGSAGSGATILGGSGANDANKFGTLTVTDSSAGAITLQNGSIIELALGGTSTTHSTLAHTGQGSISFATNQVFTFIDFGATTMTYQDIVTGTGLNTLDTSGWSISNPGWAGSFMLDASGNIDLTLTVVPEPSTWIGGALAAIVAVGIAGRKRRRCG